MAPVGALWFPNPSCGTIIRVKAASVKTIKTGDRKMLDLSILSSFFFLL